jgi:uncharacterized protein YhaN
VKQSGVTGDDELEEAVSRRTRHDTLQNTLVEVTATITTHGEALHELMHRATSTDPDQLNTELSTLGDRIGALEHRQSEESTHLGQQENELSRLDGSAVAAEAEADTAVITAALIEETEEYLRLEIAKNVLLTCIEEYRQTQADPVLTRAGHLFEKLTLGGFKGLEHDETGDSPTILARRNTGDLLAIDQLSEGTADQLYLALRLASLERYAEENRALPFTVDDIFMTFDDQRTSAALKVLDDMTDRFQTIVWTHHEHLVDLAHTVIPAGRIHLHKLPRFIPGARSPLQSVPTPKSASRPAQRDGDRTCRDCGTALAYAGRGRPPVRCVNCSN